ncbi:hypothetical protein PLANTIT3_50287 [Plantibacter sp. T3]|nr:hypothetical protein PLANTIT3_50287 [Plantibacter sp. T3]
MGTSTSSVTGRGALSNWEGSGPQTRSLSLSKGDVTRGHFDKLSDRKRCAQ